MSEPIAAADPVPNGRRYSRVAMLLHWVIAILVIVTWRVAEGAEHAPQAERAAAMAPHYAIGVTILLLTLARLVWRLTHPAPPFASDVKPWEATLARIVHTTFYVLLIGLPLGGWLAMSLYGEGIDVFGLFTVPALPLSQNLELGKAIFSAHATGGTVLLLLAALHIVGALKHTFLDRDGQIFRMLPFGQPKS